MASSIVALEQVQRADRDLRLIEEYRAGRAEAFDQLVRAYEATVYRVLAQRNVGATDVEDLAQDVFLRLYRNLHRFRGQSSFSTWLYRITINVFFDHNKKRTRADVRLRRLQTAMAEGSSAVPDPHDPFRATHDRLTTETFRRAVAALPEPFRAVVALREVADLSYEEIALQTGISVGTVRSRLSRARARLKETLRPAIAIVAASSPLSPASFHNA